MSEVRDALLALLRREAWTRGTFRLASGAESDFFIDCKRAVLTAEGHRLVGEAMFEAIPAPVDGVAGVALGGCSLASAVSLLSALRAGPEQHLDALFVRNAAKDHGTARRVEGRLVRGRRVLLLEDVLTTGGSSLAAVEALRSEGFEVHDVLALVDRDAGAVARLSAAGVRAKALFHRRDFVES